jgi:hypothetical protein
MCRLVADSNKVGTSVQRDGDVGKIGASLMIVRCGRGFGGSPEGEQLWKHEVQGGE